MSDTSLGPGWWLASDGKWYPPELASSSPPPHPQASAVALSPPQPETKNKGRGLKHPIATPFALLSLIAGFSCLALARPSHPGGFTVLGAMGTLLLIAGIVPLLIRLFAALGRFIGRCNREIMDCIRIVRRGVLSPEQVRQEFIQTQGREPTVQEVQALHQMAVTEHNQALLNAGLLAGAFYLGFRAFHHGHAQQGKNSAGDVLNQTAAMQQGRYRRFK